jgi:L-seryl-tRNA(Ser) seleniumtransferase
VSIAEPSSLNERLRRLPQVDSVLAALATDPRAADYRHDVLARLVRDELGRLRDNLLSGEPASHDSLLTPQHVADAVALRLAGAVASVLKPVVNATGVLLHTNLGRAVLDVRAQQAVAAVAGAYSNLELDLDSGKRTRRDVTLEPLLKVLTGCEAATVVNNNAAAVFLALHALAAPLPDGSVREVITSRGELVEIGGSYRVPDVVRASGAVLREVGTTNRTRLSDYEKAISGRTAVLLKTHTSNYRISGFTEETPLDQLVELGRRSGVPVLVDLGSGYIAAESGPRLDEPDVLSTLADGPDLVCFSGDKLLGGPQAGIVLGRRELIVKLRSDALWRAVRVDKFTVAALGATLAAQLLGTAPQDKPGTRYLPPAEELQALATALAARLTQAKPLWRFAALAGEGSYGGGSLPTQEVPSVLVSIEAPRLSPDRLDWLLRNGEPAVVGYAHKGVFMLNMLTLLPGDSERIARRVAELPDE